MEYLYYADHRKNTVSRCEIKRQTDLNYFVVLNPKSKHETKVNKKNMRVGKGYISTKFYVETNNLLSQWKESQLKKLFHKKLRELEKCTDKAIMEKVIKI